MKPILFTLLFASNLSYASHIIEKYTHGGYTVDDNGDYIEISEECKVWGKRAVRTDVKGDSRKVKRFTHNYTQSYLQNLAEKAMKEKLYVEENGVCDTPATSIWAFVDGKRFSLYYTGECGENFENREGSASRKLRKIIAKFCPKTVQPYRDR